MFQAFPGCNLLCYFVHIVLMYYCLTTQKGCPTWSYFCSLQMFLVNRLSASWHSRRPFPCDVFFSDFVCWLRTQSSVGRCYTEIQKRVQDKLESLRHYCRHYRLQFRTGALSISDPGCSNLVRRSPGLLEISHTVRSSNKSARLLLTGRAGNTMQIIDCQTVLCEFLGLVFQGIRGCQF